MPRCTDLWAALALAAAAALLPSRAAAQSADAWQFGAALYLYLPSVGQKTQFGQSGSGSEVTIDPSKILDSLNSAFMGSFEARRGVWGFYTDIVYVDFSNSRSGSRDLTIGGQPLPVGASANLSFGITGSAWTLAGTWRAIPDRVAPFDVLVGARMLDMKETFSWQTSGNIGPIPGPGQSGSREAHDRNWDFIAGVKGRVAFGPDRKWFAPYYADMGTGDSDFTWQAYGGIGYAFSWGEIVGAYRHLDYHMKSGQAIHRLTFDGPAIAAVFHW
jgi:hypothetical protein